MYRASKYKASMHVSINVQSLQQMCYNFKSINAQRTQYQINNNGIKSFVI